MAKYFEAHGIQRKPAGIDWISIGVVGGCLFGVYEAVDPAEVTKLVRMAQDPASGIEEVTAEYFQAKTGRPLFVEPVAPIKPDDVVVPKPATPKQIKGNGKTIVVENCPVPEAVASNTTRDLNLDEVLKVNKF